MVKILSVEAVEELLRVLHVELLGEELLDEELIGEELFDDVL